MFLLRHQVALVFHGSYVARLVSVHMVDQYFLPILEGGISSEKFSASQNVDWISSSCFISRQVF